MTLVQAQACLSAIIGAGFNASASKNPDQSWTVTALSPSGSILVSDANALVVSQAVIGRLSQVQFT